MTAVEDGGVIRGSSVSVIPTMAEVDRSVSVSPALNFNLLKALKMAFMLPRLER